MAAYEYDRQASVAYVRLDRAEARNALSLDLILGLTERFTAIAADPTIRIVVLSGKGRHFCAGADLAWMRASIALSAEENRREAELLGTLFAAIDRLPQAVIGDVHGAAIGGGAGLAAVCDYVLARDDSFFCFSEVKLGLIPAVIAPYVINKIGRSASRAYFTSALRFDAARARELGLVHEVVSEADHAARLAALLAAYTSAAPGAVAAAKELLHTLAYEPPADKRGLDHLTAEAIARRRVSEEAQQGIAAFLDGMPVPWQQ